jgi:hypothetical protein
MTINKANKFNMISVDVAKRKLDIALDDKYTITVANDEEDFTKAIVINNFQKLD